MSRSLYCAHKAQRGYFSAWVGHYPRLMRFGFSQDVPNLGLVLTISPEFKISGRELGKKEGSFRRITWSSTEGAQRKQFRKGKKKGFCWRKPLGGGKGFPKSGAYSGWARRFSLDNLPEPLWTNPWNQNRSC